jgi:hypothetical protein
VLRRAAIGHSTDGGATWTPKAVYDNALGKHQWFPWADFLPNGDLAVAWDEDVDASMTPYPPHWRTTSSCTR